MFAKEILERCISLLYPDSCLLCGRIIGYSESHFCLCADCAEHIAFLDERKTCRICGVPLSEPDYGQNDTLCITCQTHIHDFDRAVACFSYDGDLRKAILRYKFSDHRELCRPFAALMLNRIKPFLLNQAFDAVLCAPLSLKRYRQRGYNQSSLLAKRIAKGLDLPFWEDAFIKPIETPQQSSLHYAERLRNVKNAYALALPRKTFEGKRFILIDDILTTGATADALAGLLKHAGAAYVLVETIAVTELTHADALQEADLASLVF